MNEIDSKICPVCQLVIETTDEITSCPICEKQYHKNCWEKNEGCVTVHSVVSNAQSNQDLSLLPVPCRYCGAVLAEDQDFCVKCGTPKVMPPRVFVCEKCNAELQPEQEFCHKCGQKQNSQMSKTIGFKGHTSKKKKTIVLALLGCVIVGLIIFVGLSLPSFLLKGGNYQQAYNLSNDEQKKDVYVENLIALQSAATAEMLKDPTSFDLRDAWYDGDATIILLVAGKNSYGGVVTSYWYYIYDESTSGYILYTTLSSLEEEEPSSWDDATDIYIIALENIARNKVSEMIADDSMQLKDSSVDNINSLFAADKLEDVTEIVL